MAAWILERSILWIVAYVDALMRVRANCFPRMWSRAGAHSHSNQITRVLWQPSRNINAHTRRSNAERRDSSRRAPPLPLLFKIAPLWPQACTIRAPQQLSSEATALCDRVVVVHCDPQIIDMVHMPNGGAYAPDLMKRPQILLCARCTTLEHPPGKGQMPPHTIYAFYGTRRNRTAAPVMSSTSFELAARLVEVRPRPARPAPPVRWRCCSSVMPPCGVRRARVRALWCRCAV